MGCFAAELAALLTRWGYNNVDAALVMAQVDADGGGEIDKGSRAQQKIVSMQMQTFAKFTDAFRENFWIGGDANPLHRASDLKVLCKSEMQELSVC